MKQNRKKIEIIVIILIILVASIITVGIVINNKTKDKELENKTISINVFNKENKKIYDKSIETDKEYLADILKESNDLKVITESSEYGEYIISIMDIEQGDNFYWSYYIDNDYATVGISNCKVEDGKKYDFKIEKFEQ